MKIYYPCCVWLLLFSAPSFAQQNLSPLENEIRAFEAEDKTTPPPTNPIVFTGSSSIRLWSSVKQDFPDKVVLPRGFGGSTLSDVIRYADRIIIPYKPKQIILYAGENDVASGQVTAQEVYQRFVTLFTTIRKALPKVPFVYISMKPSPSRRRYLPIIQEGNTLIRRYLARRKRTAYVDVYLAMLGADGQPRRELFKSDSLHMNEKGYAIWAEKLRPVVK